MSDPSAGKCRKHCEGTCRLPLRWPLIADLEGCGDIVKNLIAVVGGSAGGCYMRASMKKKIAEMYTDRWKTTVQRRTRMLNFKKSLSLKISRITTLEIHWASNLPALQFHVEKCLGFFGWDHLADKEWRKHRAMSLRQRSKIFELVRAIQTFFLCYCSALHGRIVTCHQQVQQSKSCNDSSLTAKLLKRRVYVIHGSVYFPKKKGLQASNPTDPFQTNGGYSAISQCLHQMIFSDVSSTH